jgi:hypothetical protein
MQRHRGHQRAEIAHFDIGKAVVKLFPEEWAALSKYCNKKWS